MGRKDRRLIRSSGRNRSRLLGTAVPREDMSHSRRGGCGHWQKIPETLCNSTQPFGNRDNGSVRHEGRGDSTAQYFIFFQMAVNHRWWLLPDEWTIYDRDLRFNEPKN